MDGAEDGGAWRSASVSIETDALEAARLGLHRAAPARSARRVLFWTQAGALSLAGWALWLALQRDSATASRVLLWIAYALFAMTTLWRLWAAANLTPVLSRLGEPRDGQWPVYTVLCPLYREAAVVFELIAALNQIDYPRDALDVKILLEADDADTVTAAITACSGEHIEILVLPPAAPRTKPKALNVGLARARGAFVCVYDAEDRPHPLQLRASVLAFEDGGPRLASLQAPLVIDNGATAWISRQFAAEYAIQFREVLPLLARLGAPIPLGGSSNHFRIEALRAAGGWDSYNVTEDIDLAYRLARDGWTSGVIAPPTWEEAPITLRAWLKQRTRWVKGHLHTWLILMRDPIRTARELGAKGFWSMQLVLGGGVAASFLHGPLALTVLWAIISPDDTLGLAGFVLALSGYCVGVFGALTAAGLSRDLSHLRAIPTMPFYWPLSSIAAIGALFGLILRPHFWAKTDHGASPRAAAPFRQG